MKIKLLAAASLALISLCSSVHSQTVRILPVGDSITFGSGGTGGLGGYRGPLYDLLVDAGHSIDYVGTSTGNSALMADMDHEGHGGWTISQIDANIAGWFAAIDDPDIILLHIGTNDFGGGVDTVNAINRLDALITKMADLRPGAHVIVTNLMERSGQANTNIQTQFNPFVEGVVDDQIAAGNLVSFLDMRAAVPLSDMPDNLHPNQTGYGKMAGAWLGAIEAIIDLDDSVPPSIVSASSQSRDQVVVRFNRPLDQTTAETTSNYALSGGLSVLSSVLSANPRVVTLATDAQTPGETYTLTVNSVQDQVTPTPNTIAADSMVQFTTAPLPPPPGAVGRVSATELGGMQLLYAVDHDQFDFEDPYTIDNSAAHPIGSFPRVAYFVELGSAGDTQWAWVSMDTFNPDPLLVGVPKSNSNIVEQGTLVTNLNIESNHPNLVDLNGVTEQNGIIEFWASNYNNNGAGQYNSDNGLFDWKDSNDGTTNFGHGSFQVFHLAGTAPDFTDGAGTTVFGVTRNGGSGIGDQPANGPNGNSPDWTFGPNANTYEIRNVEVWVGNSGGELPPVALVFADQGGSSNEVIVTFNRPLDLASAETPSNYTLSGGLSVLSAVLSANQQAVTLTTSEQSPDVTYTLTVNGVQDLATPTPNTIAAGSMTDFTTPPPPAAIGRVSAAELAGMQLLYAFNDDQFDFNDPYAIDNSASHPSGSFPRVAYFVELGSAGNTQWVWASMDTFNPDPLLIGVPQANTNIVEQGTLVDNLHVQSNHPNLAAVVGAGKDGIIEFWASNHNPDGVGQFGSDDVFYDWKDGGERSTNSGFGSFQVFAFTDATRTDANTVFGITANGGSGIGDQPANGPNGNSPDWTFGPGTGTYEIRNVEIWVGVGEEVEPPPVALVAATTEGQASNRIVVAFNRPLDPASAQDPSNYTLSGGLTVLSAVLSANQRTVTLTTSEQSPELTYTLTVNGVQDQATPTPNTVVAESMTEFTAQPAPPISAAVGRVSATELAGMQLLYAVNNDQFDFEDPYTVDNSADHPTGSFPRVAYFVELGTAADPQWAWASMDTFNSDPLLVGVPKSNSNIVE
ncbi:MAG: lysophospholipase L1-like esterase, partial [Pseudoalteromonas tetraodonis]